MPELRWILIVGGALLLLGIYLWGRRSARETSAAEDSMLKMGEPAREPSSAFVFREESSADLESVTADAESFVAGDDLPISAARVHWREEAALAEQSVPDADGLTDVAARMPGKDRDVRRTRIEPTLGTETGAHIGSEGDVADRGAHQPSQSADSPQEYVTQQAPTLSSSSTPPPPRRVERRKIIALRIAAGPQRLGGEQLLEAMLAEGLQHGKYEVFHRLDDAGGTLFSVASMVEPGTFDLERMRGQSFPGITLFTQFPGAVESMLAFNELVLSARRLQEQLGGTLQDDRGVPLTVHRVERLRQDIREFEQGHGRDGRHHTDTTSSSTTS